MTKSVEADVMPMAAEPLVHQHAPEIRPYGHAIRMLIAHMRSSSTKHEPWRAHHEVDRLDAVAGSEFVDDRIRLRD
jgi:hypothetical protein